MFLHRGFLFTLLAVFTDSFYHHFYMFGSITFRKFYFRCHYIIKAIGIMAVVTHKVNMMIMMMAFGTFIFTQRIPDGIIGRRNGMYNAFVNKSL